MNLTSKDKGWLGIVIALWLIVLAALIFIVPKGNTHAAPTGSLASTLNQISPASGPALLADAEINPAQIYGDEYEGLVTLCGNEPDEYKQAKAALVNQELDLGGEYDYVLVFPAQQGAPVKVDQVPTSQAKLCPEINGQPAAMNQAIPVTTPLPFYKNGATWELGYRL